MSKKWMQYSMMNATYFRASTRAFSMNENPIYFSDQNINPGYIYQLIDGDQTFNGILSPVGLNKSILKHELTNRQRVDELFYQFSDQQLQLTPLIGIYQNEYLFQRVNLALEKAEVVSEKSDRWGITHRLLRVNQGPYLVGIATAIANLDQICIADGHHRCAAMEEYSQINAPPDNSTNSSALFALFHTKNIRTTGCSILINNTSIDESILYRNWSLLFSIVKASKETQRRDNDLLLFLKSNMYILTPRSEIESCLMIEIFDRLICKNLLQIDDYTKNNNIELFFEKSFQTEPSRLLRGRASGAIGIVLPPEIPAGIFEFARQNKILKPNSTFFEPKLIEKLIVYDFSHLNTLTCKN